MIGKRKSSRAGKRRTDNLSRRPLGEVLEDRLLLSLTPVPVGARTVEVSSFERLTAPVGLGDQLFFVNTDEAGGELWKSDGTAEGTERVADIWPGSQGSFPDELEVVDDTLFFVADNGTHGPELWKSDGTTQGTVLVADIWSGAVGSTPNGLTNVGGTLFFIADDGTSGRELWKSDGTAEGTELVADLNLEHTPGHFTDVDGTLFFSTLRMDGLGQRRWATLWKSDGTAAGTVQLKDESLAVGEEMVNANGTLYFPANDTGVHRDYELWKSDGTAEGTVVAADILAEALTSSAGKLFFAAGGRLWVSDGTPEGTQQLTPRLQQLHRITDVDGTVFFSNNRRQAVELWTSDGTQAGTELVKIIPMEIRTWINSFFTNNGTLFFKDGYRDELWASDGTSEGTNVVTQTPLRHMTATDSGLFFTTQSNKELWKTDGTVTGTARVTDLKRQAIVGGIPSGKYLTEANGKLFYVSGNALMMSDGTSAGTVVAADIWSGPHGTVNSLRNIDDTLYFSVKNSEIWKWDDAAGVPVRVSEETVPPAGGLEDDDCGTCIDGTHFFLDGHELRKSDGATKGTLVADFWPADAFPPYHLTKVAGTLFFFADDGRTGQELWRSDGTAEGTVLVADAIPGPRGIGSNCIHCVNRYFGIENLGNSLFFGGGGGLWKLEAPPGDTNFDGQVDFQDFLRLSSNFGRRGEEMAGDLNFDDQVDFADFIILSANFGKYQDGQRLEETV